jgi:hypothetical protein
VVGALVKAAKTQGIKVKIRAVKYKSGQLSATLLMYGCGGRACQGR